MQAQRGFTLIEVLIALAILTVAVLGVAATTVLQGGEIGGSAGAISFGQAAVTRGYYQSTATILAQDRLEQVKRLRYTVPPNPAPIDQFGTSLCPTLAVPTGFPDEPVGTIAGYPNFSRQVRFCTGPPQAPATNVKLVTVTVAFTLPTAQGANQESINIKTLVAARP